MGKLKGQIFIAGAIVILVMIAITVINLKYESPGYNKFLFRDIDNLDKEFRFSSSIGNLDEFMGYVYSNKNDFRACYLTADPKITIANFLGTVTEFTILSSGFTQSVEIGNGQKADIDKSLTVFNISYRVDGVLNSEEIFVKDRTVFVDFMIKDNELARKKSIYHIESNIE
ncbi:MAG: hypothetical protein V1870_00590 [Candidatus Aenigmatarchaeota archaeon]